jgi:hypothetical protein
MTSTQRKISNTRVERSEHRDDLRRKAHDPEMTTTLTRRQSRYSRPIPLELIDRCEGTAGGFEPYFGHVGYGVICSVH